MSKKDSYKKYNFLGTEIAAVTFTDLFYEIDVWLKDKNNSSHHVAIINAYCATFAFQNPKLAQIYNNADLVGPDGKPFVYWLKIFRRSPCDQFDASSLVNNLAKRAREKKYSFYLYGGHPDVLENMKKKLEELYPHINIVGYKSPPFRGLTEEEDRQVCEEINRLKPDILYVGLGTPKQDYWIDDHKEKIKGSVMIPCGAIFDFFGGRIKRAPKFIQKACLEWLYRLFSKDFFRLWHRYTVMNMFFLWHFLLQVLRIRVREPLRRER